MNKELIVTLSFYELEKFFGKVPRENGSVGNASILMGSWLEAGKQAILQEIKVNVNDSVSEEFEVNLGVDQDSLLSPLPSMSELTALFFKFGKEYS